ncbi:unnamed protein product [Vitrella brassicaformis CCMP3155]|uniref:Uncharacterized protein n=1 Tax=Vitrella brassicaformis (strain CCMP3155) TaxID=1169540 RepID=A0A0G4FAS8_VITBC|nr:unnamed protein product [Vitrella brassicaformis CCMP3155]|eukprot:CEM09719.1 unnamed protein product [Vitrella brassicaformis CCMP3155]
MSVSLRVKVGSSPSISQRLRREWQLYRHVQSDALLSSFVAVADEREGVFDECRLARHNGEQKETVMVPTGDQGCRSALLAFQPSTTSLTLTPTKPLPPPTVATPADLMTTLRAAADVLETVVTFDEKGILLADPLTSVYVREPTAAEDAPADVQHLVRVTDLAAAATRKEAAPWLPGSYRIQLPTRAGEGAEEGEQLPRC